MGILDFIVRVAIVFVTTMIYILIKHYWPKYFETKATNQATKEDIGEITKIVEGIKNELTQSLEIFKISYSGLFKEKIDVYRTLLKFIVDINNLVQSYNINPTEERALEFMTLVNSLINYLLINRPFIKDAISDKINEVREVLAECFDNYYRYYQLSKVGYSGPELIKYLSKAFESKNFLGGELFKTLQDEINMEIRKDLNILHI